MDTSSPGPPPPPTRHRTGMFAIAAAVLLLVGAAALFLASRPPSTRTGRAAGATNAPSIPAVEKSPDEVLDEYLRYRLVERSDADARPLLCSTPDLADVDSYVADIKSRESRFHVTIRLTWNSFTDSRAPDGTVKVGLDLTKTIPDQESASDPWTFSLSDENGWKICSGHLTPTS